MTGLVTLDRGSGVALASSTEIAAVETRETQMIQGMIISARKFPRDETAAFGKIMRACERPTFAEVAMYAYPRGGQTITGPSIRLAQVVKQCWGNMRSGWRETERLPGRSKVYTIAWDLETNAIDDIEFVVEHVRDTKGGAKALTDVRDIYEMVANFARRRERANIMAVVPGDIVEAAVERCKLTLEKATDLAKAIPNMLKAFAEHEVSREQIEARIRKKITSLGHTEYVQLRAIYQSLKDGASKTTDWFDALHEPQKMTREVEADGVASKVSADVSAKAQALAGFQKAQAALVKRGGTVEGATKKTVDELMKLDATALMAAVDLMEAWTK